MKIVYRSVRRDIEKALDQVFRDRMLENVKYIRVTGPEWPQAIREFGVRNDYAQRRGAFEFAYAPPMTATEMNQKVLSSIIQWQFTIVAAGSPEDTER